MAADGIEKRRKGPVNRMRRMLYGLLLGSAAAPGFAAAADNGASRLPQAMTNAQLRQEGEVLLVRDGSAPSRSPMLAAYGGLAPMLTQAATISPDFAFAPLGKMLLTAHFLGTELDSLGKGLGVDLLVPELGYFHLNLYNGPGGPNQGKRLRIQPEGFDMPQTENQAWSLGASLELARGYDDRRRLQFVPQLVLNLDRCVPIGSRMQAVLSYRNWHAAGELDAVESRPIPQLALHWAM
jgi:hypothetical protein